MSSARQGRGRGNGTGIPKAGSPLGQFIARKKAVIYDVGLKLRQAELAADWERAKWFKLDLARIEAARTQEELEEANNGTGN